MEGAASPLALGARPAATHSKFFLTTHILQFAHALTHMILYTQALLHFFTRLAALPPPAAAESPAAAAALPDFRFACPWPLCCRAPASSGAPPAPLSTATLVCTFLPCTACTGVRGQDMCAVVEAQPKAGPRAA